MHPAWQTIRAAPWLVLAVLVHLALVGFLACVVFPWRGLRQWLGPFGPAAAVSMGVNALGVILLALWQLAAAAAWSEPELVVRAEAVEPQDAPLLLPPDLEGASRQADSEAVAQEIAAAGKLWEAATIEYSDLLVASSTGRGLGDLDSDALGREVGGRSDTAQGIGQADFFGITAGGSRFVFVVDMSGSMEGTRMRRARNELRRSIQSLNESQQFFVVFFNTQAHPMPARGMLPATRENVSEIVRWFDKVKPQGNTYPFAALLMAIQFRPDAVFLLSDGEFDPVIVDQVLLSQRDDEQRVPIHTIGFTSREGEAVLRVLSEKSGGTYRFVR